MALTTTGQIGKVVGRRDSGSPFSFFRYHLLRSILFLTSILVRIICSGEWRAWARNSMALGYHSELSDLDVTVFSDSSSVPPQRLLNLWRIFRRFGEWALYTKEDLAFSDLSNSYEIERDPSLKQIIGERQEAPGDDFVFWLRMVEADGYLRSEKKCLRRAKWSFHLRQIANRGVITERRILDSHPFPEFIEEVGLRLSQSNFSPRSVLCESSGTLQSYLRPHRWLGGALAEGLSTERILSKIKPDPSSYDLLAVARAQIRWEAWGLMGQVRLNGNYEQVIKHLSNLCLMLPSDDPLIGRMEEFLVYLNKLKALQQK